MKRRFFSSDHRALGTKYPNMIISFIFKRMWDKRVGQDRTDRNAGRNKLVLTVKTSLRSRAAHSLNNMWARSFFPRADCNFLAPLKEYYRHAKNACKNVKRM
jgi:hypothetical protein